MQPLMIFQIIVLIYSVILHEVAHGYAAYIFGDKTAYYKNRLTLNPIPHIDLMGSIFVPLFLILTNSSFFAGWAKPVPVATYNLNPYKLGNFVVSFAGVFVNFLITSTFTIIGSQVGNADLKTLCFLVAMTNLSLAIFNLIPFPPADGYRILSTIMPWNINRKVETYIQKYFLPIILISIFLSMQVFGIIFPYLANFLQKIIF